MMNNQANEKSTPKLNLLATMCIAVIRFYQQAISPYLGKKCRFQPTCSRYAIDAIKYHGAIKGGGLFIKRFLKCHPWGGFGYDPVPSLTKSSTSLHATEDKYP